MPLAKVGQEAVETVEIAETVETVETVETAGDRLLVKLRLGRVPKAPLPLTTAARCIKGIRRKPSTVQILIIVPGKIILIDHWIKTFKIESASMNS